MGDRTEYHRAYQAANREQIRARKRKYDKLPHAIEARVAYVKANPEPFRQGRKAWVERNPEKYKAQRIVANAVARRHIIKPKICDLCGEVRRLEGHHADYSKPLEVTWLCRPCHLGEHAQ